MKIAACHLNNAQNSELASRFFKYLFTPVLGNNASYSNVLPPSSGFLSWRQDVFSETLVPIYITVGQCQLLGLYSVDSNE